MKYAGIVANAGQSSEASNAGLIVTGTSVAFSTQATISGLQAAGHRKIAGTVQLAMATLALFGTASENPHVQQASLGTLYAGAGRAGQAAGKAAGNYFFAGNQSTSADMREAYAQAAGKPQASVTTNTSQARDSAIQQAPQAQKETVKATVPAQAEPAQA